MKHKLLSAIVLLLCILSVTILAQAVSVEVFIGDMTQYLNNKSAVLIYQGIDESQDVLTFLTTYAAPDFQFKDGPIYMLFYDARGKHIVTDQTTIGELPTHEGRHIIQVASYYDMTGELPPSASQSSQPTRPSISPDTLTAQINGEWIDFKLVRYEYDDGTPVQLVPDQYVVRHEAQMKLTYEAYTPRNEKLYSLFLHVPANAKAGDVYARGSSRAIYLTVIDHLTSVQTAFNASGTTEKSYYGFHMEITSRNSDWTEYTGTLDAFTPSMKIENGSFHFSVQ